MNLTSHIVDQHLNIFPILLPPHLRLTFWSFLLRFQRGLHFSNQLFFVYKCSLKWQNILLFVHQVILILPIVKQTTMIHILTLTRLRLLRRYVKVVLTPCVSIQFYLKNIGVVSFQQCCFAPHEPSVMSRVVTLSYVFSSRLVLEMLHEIITSCRMNMVSTSMQIYPTWLHFQTYVSFLAF